VPSELVVPRRQVKRPTITKVDRLVIVGASALTKTWRDALSLVQPETRPALATADIATTLAATAATPDRV